MGTTQQPPWAGTVYCIRVGRTSVANRASRLQTRTRTLRSFDSTISPSKYLSGDDGFRGPSSRLPTPGPFRSGSLSEHSVHVHCPGMKLTIRDERAANLSRNGRLSRSIVNRGISHANSVFYGCCSRTRRSVGDARAERQSGRLVDRCRHRTAGSGCRIAASGVRPPATVLRTSPCLRTGILRSTAVLPASGCDRRGWLLSSSRMASSPSSSRQ